MIFILACSPHKAIECLQKTCNIVNESYEPILQYFYDSHSPYDFDNSGQQLGSSCSQKKVNHMFLEQHDGG